MIVRENGLLRNIKHAYRTSGYFVSNSGEVYFLFTPLWYAEIPRGTMSNRVLALIVEHMGALPETGAAVELKKGEDPQMILWADFCDRVDLWRNGEQIDTVMCSSVIMSGLWVFQPIAGGACYGSPGLTLGMITDVEDIPAAVIGGDRLSWSHEGETVIVAATRKATGDYAKAWERAVWSALEGVVLHNE